MVKNFGFITKFRIYRSHHKL